MKPNLKQEILSTIIFLIKNFQNSTPILKYIKIL